MTLREFIECLQDLIAEEEVGEQIEVVAVDHASGESYTPVISVGRDKDGERRLFVA